MNKDIKKLISEAFEELYQEMINEAPEKLKVRGIRDEDVPALIQKSLKYGTEIPYNFEGGDMKSKRNFDKIINKLVDDYRNTKNPNAKKAIQSSMYPYAGSEIMHAIGGNKFYGHKELEDAALDAYTEVVIKNFDNILNTYKAGTNLGALFVKGMKNKVLNYLKGYRGDGGSSLDAVGGSEKPLSLDKPMGDGEITFGDKISSKFKISPESPDELEYAKEKTIATQKEIIRYVIEWLDNKFEDEGNEIGKRRMIAFKGLMAGDSPEDIASDYPGYFKEDRLITQEFTRLVNSSAAKEISDIISDKYKINFNLANIDPLKLKQTSSMNPKFGGFSKMIRQATPEMEIARDELSDALAVVGLKLAQFSSEENKERVISNLKNKGMKDELKAIIDASSELDKATEKAKNQGKYQQLDPVLPSSPEEEKKSGERMFEDIDINKLMERVFRRIKK